MLPFWINNNYYTFAKHILDNVHAINQTDNIMQILHITNKEVTWILERNSRYICKKPGK
jgi:hypothetical protein